MENPGQNNTFIDHLNNAGAPAGPDLGELMNQVRRLRTVTAQQVTERFCGEYHAAFRGQGIEFDEVREYSHGDDVRAIDWNVTARMGHPYVKRYREERELTLLLVVDVSGSLAFGSRGRTKALTAAELACLLALSADRHRDKIGLIMFSDRIERVIPPARGRNAVMRILREIIARHTSERGTDIGQALQFMNRIRKRRAVVFLISDFLDDGYQDELLSTSRRHDLIACRISDTAENRLPAAGLLEIRDPESERLRVIDTSGRSTRKTAATWAQERELNFQRLCRRLRLDTIELSGHLPVAPVVQALFRRRQRRARGFRALDPVSRMEKEFFA